MVSLTATRVSTGIDTVELQTAATGKVKDGVICFVPNVSSNKNLEMELSDWLMKNCNQLESGFSS